MRREGILASIFAMCCSTALAQPIGNALKDAPPPSPAGPPPAIGSQTIGEFRYAVREDGFTNARVAEAVNAGSGGILSLKCDAPGERSVYVQVVAPSYLGAQFGALNVNHRFDNGEPLLTQWGGHTYSVTQKNLPGQGPEFVSLLNRMAAAQRYRLRIETRSGRVDMDFAMNGAPQALAKLAADCRDTWLASRLSPSSSPKP